MKRVEGLKGIHTWSKVSPGSNIGFSGAREQVEEGNEMVEATEAFHHALLIEDDPFEIEVKRQHMIEEMADA